MVAVEEECRFKIDLGPGLEDLPPLAELPCDLPTINQD